MHLLLTDGSKIHIDDTDPLSEKLCRRMVKSTKRGHLQCGDASGVQLIEVVLLSEESAMYNITTDHDF